MPKPAFVIMVDRANPRELAKVGRLVRERADAWWHRFTNIWIVKGGQASTWRDLCKEAIEPGPSSVLVMRLPDDPKRRDWAFFGPTQDGVRTKWLKKSFRS